MSDTSANVIELIEHSAEIKPIAILLAPASLIMLPANAGITQQRRHSLGAFFKDAYGANQTT